MPDNENQSAPATEGVSAPESQQTQGTAPEQEASSQVETGDNASASQAETRKPTDFWAGRQIKKLERSIAQLQQELRESRQAPQAPPSPAPEAPAGIDPNLYWKNPFAYLQAMKQQIRDEMDKSYMERESARSLDTGRREARDLILKNDLVKKDPQWRERFDEILQDSAYDLDNMSLQFPRQAAAIALEIYKAKYSNGAANRSPYAGTKSGMRSTATGVSSAPTRITAEDVEKMTKELSDNPNLASDPAFLARLSALKQFRVQNSNQE